MDTQTSRSDVGAPGMIKTVDIIGKKYKIMEVPLERENGHLGRSIYGYCLIEVYHPQDDQQMKDTLLHEILHACLFEVGRGAQEEVVGALAPVLLYVLRKNPKLVEYLTE